MNRSIKSMEPDELHAATVAAFNAYFWFYLQTVC